MKIYEKPSVEIKKFDVEDVITASQEISGTTTSTDLQTMTGNNDAVGVVFEW